MTVTNDKGEGKERGTIGGKDRIGDNRSNTLISKDTKEYTDMLLIEAENRIVDVNTNRKEWYFSDEPDIKKRLWLEAYASSRKIEHSCVVAGVSKKTVYDWRRSDEGFNKRMEIARVIASETRLEWLTEILDDRIRDRRAPMSSILLLAALKREDPEYRDNPPEVKEDNRRITINVIAPDNFKRAQIVDVEPKQIGQGSEGLDETGSSG